MPEPSEAPTDGGGALGEAETSNCDELVGAARVGNEGLVRRHHPHTHTLPCSQE